MQKTKFTTTIAVLGMLTLGAGNLCAGMSDLETVTIKCTVTIPGATTVKGTVTKHAVDTMKVTTKDILNLIADNTSASFPSDAQLVMVDWQFFSVYNGDPNGAGIDLLDVSSDLMSASYNNDISKSTRNSSTGSETYDNTYITYLTFDDSLFNDNGDYFHFFGLSNWKSSYNGNNGKFSESIHAQGPLEGSVSGDDFVGSGTMTGKGKGTEL
jgi:hypothetical protein